MLKDTKHVRCPEDSIWLLEARNKNRKGKYYPFCGSIGCRSKYCATSKISSLETEYPYLKFRVTLYKRI